MIAEKVQYVDDKQLNIDFPHGLGLHEAQNLMRHLKNDAQVHVYVNYTSYYSDESWPVEKEMGDIGITGTPLLTASKKLPRLNGKSSPEALRVPSGNIKTDVPLFTLSAAASMLL